MALDSFKADIKALHARKSAAYGSAWKKRGEVIGVLANIARKVDRLEVLVKDPSAADSESMMDTAVDLLVYSLKYQTFLADLDSRVAARLFNGPSPPHSEGTRGFDYLLDGFSCGRASSVQAGIEAVVHQFKNLEAGFSGLQENSGALIRAREAGEMARLAGDLVAALSTPGMHSLMNEASRKGA